MGAKTQELNLFANGLNFFCRSLRFHDHEHGVNGLSDHSKCTGCSDLRAMVRGVYNTVVYLSEWITQDGSGALIIYETDSMEAAEELLRADPFHQAGVFARWSLRPWTVAHVNLPLFPQSP